MNQLTARIVQGIVQGVFYTLISASILLAPVLAAGIFGGELSA